MVVDVKDHFVLRYRFFCLLIFIGYSVYRITVTNFDNFGTHCRYLTVWGLTGALIVIFLIYETKRKGEPERYLPLVSALAVLNAMTVFLLEAVFHKSQFSKFIRINFLVSGTFFTQSWSHACCYRFSIF